jgi:hypothetical protein
MLATVMKSFIICIILLGALHCSQEMMHSIYWTVRGSNSNLSLLQNVHTGSGDYPASCSVGTGVPSRRLGGHEVNLTANLYPVPRLRMSGAIPLLPLCASMDKENFAYVCTYVRTYVCMYVCMYVCIYIYINKICAYTGVSFVFLSTAGITGCASGSRISVRYSCRVHVQDIHSNQRAAPTIVHISIYCKSCSDELNDNFTTYWERYKS